jgi:hypothetical protein
MPADTTCFVIAPIGAPDSATRKRSDQVLRHIITPAAKECGFTTLRADEISEPGIITSQVIQHIIEDAMLVADLTEHNPNVFYELAIRHAVRRPYVQIIENGDALPFDVAGVRSIQFTFRDLDSANYARNEIINQMRSMAVEGANIASPVTVAVDLSALTKSNDPKDRHLGDVLNAIAELNVQVASLRQQIGTRGVTDYSGSPNKVTLSGISVGSSHVESHGVIDFFSGPTGSMVTVPEDVTRANVEFISSSVSVSPVAAERPSQQSPNLKKNEE